MQGHGWKETVLACMSVRHRAPLEALLQPPEEVVFRAGAPLMIRQGGKEKTLLNETLLPREVQALYEALCQHSLYAWQDQVRQGFLTLRGGHRVGLCGRVVRDVNGKMALTQVGSMVIRIAREQKGCADALLSKLGGKGDWRHTLIVSPPGMGKTTLLRDIARGISQKGDRVSVVDERSELAACHNGIPQLDVGEHTHVLDNCTKAEGMSMMVRNIAPQVLITDELGTLEDVGAVMEALRCGVTVMASAHGRTAEDIKGRKGLCDLCEGRVFERYVFLARDVPGRIAAVLDEQMRVIP